MNQFENTAMKRSSPGHPPANKLTIIVFSLLWLTMASALLVHPRRNRDTSLRSMNTYVDLKLIDFSPHIDSTEPAVLLLHGLLGSKRNFASIGASLASQLDKKRRILAMDLRNHGENHHDWRPTMRYEEMALDVIGTLDKHQLKKVVLVGHSMGGKVAQTLALLHPDRIAGLVVIDIAPVAYEHDDPSWKAVMEIINLLRNIVLVPGQSKRDVDKLFQEKIPDPALRAFVMTNLDPKVPRWKIDINSIGKELETLAGFEVVTDITYRGDALFINGGQSRFVRHAHMESIAGYFPNHMLTTIRGVGHWVHAEAPDDTLALLKRYLDR